MLAGASNFTISGSARLYEIHGNAVINHLTDTDELKKIQSIVNLPRAQASQKDYETNKKSGPCFPGTREALLQEMMDWATKPSESRMYVLSGLAGIGKSTVAYTVATQLDELGLLGASFFFSRDEDDRNNAKKVFTTIAYQLCAYNEMFSNAIGEVLRTERGFAVATQNPQEQLKTLILDPLQSIVESCSPPILIVVDALDECDDEDVFSVFTGLCQLVRALPSFKVFLITRPLDLVLGSQGDRQIFHLQDIEDKVIDNDIRLYLQHYLSLEEIQRRYPRRQWCASDEEIESLVRAVGRLFIVASTAIRFILDKIASNPAAQMQKLLRTSAQHHSPGTPFKDLDQFYTIILRNIVPANCDDDDIVSRYQSVVSAIVLAQHPLPISALAELINRDVDDTRAVLDKLQSVILLGGDDIPRVYHKSFPDYVTDQARCRDPRLRIDTGIRHTQIATHCFELMDKHLKRNILGLGDPARFMSNEDGLKEDGITEEKLQEKIPQQLRYACIYWVNHFEVASLEDEALTNGLDKFVADHMLYWFEVLSLIGKMDLAHHAIRVVLQLLKSTSSDLHQLLSDALRFISKFYETIERSALHTYHSALSFTPTDSLLYRRYNQDAADNICAIEGGPEKWDALVANLRHEERVQVIKFSLGTSVLVSCSEECVDDGVRIRGKLKIWDAATGTPISTISGHRFAFANNFSIVASSQDNVTTLYNVTGTPSGTMFTTPSKIEELVLSSESSRVAAVLSDATVWLWDSGNAELIDCFDDFRNEDCGPWPQIKFSPTGTRLAYSSANGIKLRDGMAGKFITDLLCGPSDRFEFSGDGSRIASVSYNCGLTLWNSESGRLIAAVKLRNVAEHNLAISANGSLLATAQFSEHEVKLWSENRGHLVQIKGPDTVYTRSMVFSLDNILATADLSRIKLYNVKTHSFICTLPLEHLDGGFTSFDRKPIPMAFSPDCTRLAVADYHDGNVNLCDIQGTRSPSKGTAPSVTALALSRDCSRLAYGLASSKHATVELRETSPTKRQIDPLSLRSKMEGVFSHIFRQSRHTTSVQALGFDPDGRLFASGSLDGTIKLWNGGDGGLRGTLKAPGRVHAVALSNSVLIAAWSVWDRRHDLSHGSVTLWSLDTLSFIHTFTEFSGVVDTVSIAENSALIAVFCPHGHVALLDAENRTTVATFDVPFTVHTMTFLPDNSELVAQSDEGAFLSFNLVNNHVTRGPTLEHLIQLPSTPFWHGVPIWHCQDKESKQHYFSALFSQHKNPVPVLWIPRDLRVAAWSQGSSMIALGCEDGRTILLRLRTGHAS